MAKHYTEHEIDIITKMFVNNKSTTDIAKTIDRKESSVIGKLNRLGYSINLTRSVWTEENLIILFDLYENDGLSIEQLAEYFDKSKRSIISILVLHKKYQKAIKRKQRTAKELSIDFESYLNVILARDINGDVNYTDKKTLIILVDGIKDKLEEGIQKT